MMTGAVDLLESERGIFCLALLVAATVLAAIGVIAASDWIAFAKYLAVALVASKTVTGAVETWRAAPAPAS